MDETLVIIGSGPAAWTAAIYAARANLHPLVFEGAVTNANYVTGTLPLGQLNLTKDVENFPGFSNGVDGGQLMVSMRTQAKRFGTRVLTRDVIDVQTADRPFRLTDSAGESVRAQAVIVATGASARYLGLPSESRFKSRGVSACAVCDGSLPRFQARPVVVVGGGDSACEEAIYLAKSASVVRLVHRGERLRASPIMAMRALSHPKVRPVWNSVVTEVIGNEDDGLTEIRLQDRSTGATRRLETSGLFLAIGHSPKTDLLKGQLETHPATGHLLLETPSQENGFARSRTSVEGFFAAGDVADATYRQAITAAASGCMAALDAQRWLSSASFL